MDQKSFDRLSVVVDRLRTGATRRETLRLLLGGSLAAAAAVSAEDAEAKKKKRNKNKCRGWGASCSRNGDCCNGRCRSRVCQPKNGNWWNGGWNGNGKRCNTPGGSVTCLPGYECCRTAGVNVCTPAGFGVCCGGNSFGNDWDCCGGGTIGFNGGCPAGFTCCGSNAGGGCCPAGSRCCNSAFGGQCCPAGFRCTSGGCTIWRTTSSGARTAETRPRIRKPTFGAGDWVAVTPGEGVADEGGQQRAR